MAGWGTCVGVAIFCENRAINLIGCFQHGGEREGGVKKVECKLPSGILWLLA